MGTWTRDLRYSLRALARQPKFTALVVAILALGLGANITVFSVFYGVLLRPLPMPQPERLVRLFQVFSAHGEERSGVSRLDAEDWAEASRSLTGLGLFSTSPNGLILIGTDEPTEIETAYVSGSFFPTLGATAARGRLITPADEQTNDQVVVLSDGCWRRRFGGDPGIVGSPVQLNGKPFIVLGVLPPAFRFPSPQAEMWAPLTLIPERSVPRLRGVRWLGAVGRLAAGATAEAAQNELSLIARGLATEHPDMSAGADAVAVVPLQEQMVGPVRPAIVALLAAVGLVLLIACANVANLLLARGFAGQRRLVIVTALGATRGRVVRQLVVESLVLALAGCALGLLAAGWAVDALAATAGEALPRAADVHLDATAIAFAFAAAVLTGLLFGLAPALRLTRPDLASGLAVRAATGGPRSPRLHGGLVVAEVALALMLMIGAGLVLRSLTRLAAVDPGFVSGRQLAVSLTVPDYKYPSRPEMAATYHAMLERLRSLPGVVAAGSIKTLPLVGEGERMAFQVEGEPTPPPGTEPWAEMLPASGQLFAALGVPLLAGRDFAATDSADAPVVAVVSAALAQHHWPGGDAIGKRLLIGPRALTIIGVVGDLRHRDLAADPRPMIYLHQEQVPRRVHTFIVRTSGDPRALRRPVLAALHEIDPQQSVTDVATLDELVSEALAPSRFFTLLLGVFAVAALALAALGIYGIVSFAVEQRTREIGVRLAVGARPDQVLRMVVRGAITLTGLGLVLGWAGALALARVAAGLLSGHLYGIAATDALTFAGVPAVLALVALLASYLPGRRAGRIDPVEALRSE